MRIRTAGLWVWIFLAVLSLVAADTGAGHGQGYVAGVVTQKFTGGRDGDSFEIAVEGSPYEVPMTFWLSVQVGDTVRYAGQTWQIVKRARASAQ
jgi:hypothetical protein